MRIKVIQAPERPSVDGIPLEHFVPGQRYDVGTLLGAYLLAEGWAEPVDPTDPPPTTPSELDADLDRTASSSLYRDTYPTDHDGPSNLARDRHRRRSH